MIFTSPHPDVSAPNISVPDYVLRHCERLADKAAIIEAATGRSYTYGQLAQAVNRVAAARWQMAPRLRHGPSLPGGRSRSGL